MPQPNPYVSSTWDNLTDPGQPEVGEVRGVPRTYANGKNPLNYLGLTHCGSDAAWQLGGDHKRDPAIRTNQNGYSGCCGVQGFSAEGGAGVGGRALFASYPPPTVPFTGGKALGGRFPRSFSFTGGKALGGRFLKAHAFRGGKQIGGSFAQPISFSGGKKIGGSFFANFYSETPSTECWHYYHYNVTWEQCTYIFTGGKRIGGAFDWSREFSGGKRIGGAFGGITTFTGGKQIGGEFGFNRPFSGGKEIGGQFTLQRTIYFSGGKKIGGSFGVFGNASQTNYAGNAFDLGGSGNSWTNTGGIIGPPDFSYADCFLSLPNAITNTLEGYQFGFAIPGGATILGIEVEVEFFDPIFAATVDTRVQLAFTSVGYSTNKATGAPLPSTATVRTYGGASDLWGAIQTPAIINDGSFGVMLEFQTDIGGGPSDPNVGSIRVTVFYI